MVSSVKLGLVGYGRIAELVHLKVLLGLPNVELVALAESDSTRREEARKLAPGAVVFADYKELLDMPDVEAVVICLPPALHAEAAIAAFQSGKHVYLEKPIATNLSDATAVLEAWRSSGLLGIIGYNYRFGELHQVAKRCIKSGHLGDLVGVRTVFSSAVRDLPDWKKIRRNGGGVLLDLASHHVDLIRFLFEEEIFEVSAGLRSQNSEDDSAVLHLRLPSGLLIQSFFSINAVDEDRLEIYGRQGKLTFDRYAGNLEITGPIFEYGRLRQIRRGLRALSYDIRRIVHPPGEPSFRAALSAFVKTIQNGRSISPNLEDGYLCLSVLEAAEESARTGRVVLL